MFNLKSQNFDELTDEDLIYIAEYSPNLLETICMLWTLNVHLKKNSKI